MKKIYTNAKFYYINIIYYKNKEKKMITYEPFRVYVASRNIKKKDIMKNTGISPATMSKLKYDKPVSTKIIERLCSFFKCDITEIIRYEEEKI